MKRESLWKGEEKDVERGYEGGLSMNSSREEEEEEEGVCERYRQRIGREGPTEKS